VSKKTAFLFLSELCQISTNFNKFWYIDGKVAEIVCYIYIFHLTWPTSLHYLVKCRCSKYLANNNTGFITVRLVRFGVKLKGILSRQPSWSEATSAGCPMMSCLCFNRTAPLRIQNTTLSLSQGKRNLRDASSSKHLCPCMRCTFRAQIVKIGADLLWQVITLPNKPYFTLLCPNSVVR